MQEAGEWKLNRKSKTLWYKTDLIKKAEKKNGGEGVGKGEDVSGRIKISIKRTTGEREKQQLRNKVWTAERFCWQRSERRRWKTELFLTTLSISREKLYWSTLLGERSSGWTSLISEGSTDQRETRDIFWGANFTQQGAFVKCGVWFTELKGFYKQAVNCKKKTMTVV